MASPAFQHLRLLLHERGLADSLSREYAPAHSQASTGLAMLDQHLGGGFVRGALTEVSGALSAGATGMAFTALAAATRRGETTAYIDATGSFHAESAALAGIALSRLLMVRCRMPHQAWDAVNLVSSAGGFGLIVLDLLGVSSRRQLREWQNRAWMKLQRSLKNTTTVLLLLSPQRGLCAQPPRMRLELDAIRMHWHGYHSAAACLEGIESSLRVGYQRHHHPREYSGNEYSSCPLFLKDVDAADPSSSAFEPTRLTNGGIAPLSLTP